MNTLYWITRLDSIVGILMLFAVISGITTFVLHLFLVTDFYDYDEEKEKEKKARKISIIVFSISSLMLAFIPSTKDAYIIYGIGGTIDYLEQNKDAKQLPDKTIKAINAFLDNQIKTDSIKKMEEKK